MRGLSAICVALLMQFTTMGQNGQSKVPAMDKSPMDVSYYPVNYPILKIQDKANEPVVARVVYSRPQKNGRLVFGELLEYNKVWRLGANEATEIEFFKDVKIGTTKIKKGRYTLYCIPTPTQWTIILNRDTDIWGAFKYDSKKDVVRQTVAVQKITELVEAFTIYFEKNNGGLNVVFTWDDDLVKLPVSL
ncbi:MAG: DUF2911 domain-containing protein [Sphingobacteriales bacterium]|nr:MAG: DUF2911 domain-containing protein [Sphingobacteriales bacterium]